MNEKDREEIAILGKYLPQYSACYKIVEKILKENVDARNSRSVLSREVMVYCLAYGMNMPAQSSINRVSRQIQNIEKRYKPNNEARKRREEMRQFYVNASREGLL